VTEARSDSLPSAARARAARTSVMDLDRAKNSCARRARSNILEK
jgi:hypothetical protein